MIALKCLDIHFYGFFRRAFFIRWDRHVDLVNVHQTITLYLLLSFRAKYAHYPFPPFLDFVGSRSFDISIFVVDHLQQVRVLIK